MTDLSGTICLRTHTYVLRAFSHTISLIFFRVGLIIWLPLRCALPGAIQGPVFHFRWILELREMGHEGVAARNGKRLSDPRVM